MQADEEVRGRLEREYRRIHETRMRGMPLLNPRLDVAVVGVSRLEGLWHGVLVTPWSMNLLALPAGPTNGGIGPPGSARIRGFPFGRLQFIAAEETGLGRYEACSLFSPVLEFADQEAALATACAVMEALFDPATDPRGQPWLGTSRSPARNPLTDRSLSRRDLIRGLLPGKG